MKTMRTKILGFLTAALVFATFGLFAGAASAAKIFTIEAKSIGANVVAVTVVNLTPENNSTINTFVLNKVTVGATQYSLVSGVAADPAGQPAVVVPDNGTLRVSGFDGLKSGGRRPNRITINVTVAFPGDVQPACGTTVGWSGTAYTGNFSNTVFALVDASGTPVPSIPQSLNCYTLSLLPGTVYGGTSNKPSTAKLKNLNPVGGSSIGSLTLSTTKSSGTGATGVTASTVFTSPVAPQQEVNVAVTLSTECGAFAGNWKSTVTGTLAETFTGTNDPAAYVVSPCTISFDTGPPQSVGLNVAIDPPMVISAKDGEGNALAWDGVVTWGLIPLGSAGAGSVTGDTTPTCVNSISGGCSAYSFDAVKVTSGTIGGSYNLTASTSLGSAIANTTTTYPTAFTLWGGILGCDALTRKAGNGIDPTDLKTYVKETDQGKWGLIRGANKDGATCVAVPYTFVLDIMSSPQLASFIVPDPTASGQKIAAQFVVVWGRVAVNASGNDALWTAKRPMLSWGTPSLPVPGTNDFVPALACVNSPADPALYPNGLASVLYTDLNALLPVIPNVAPFNTPMTGSCPNCIFGNPAYPQYQPGQKAKMCAAQQGWTSVGVDGSGNTLVQYWTNVIDQADGFMSLD